MIFGFDLHATQKMIGWFGSFYKPILGLAKMGGLKRAFLFLMYLLEGDMTEMVCPRRFKGRRSGTESWLEEGEEPGEGFLQMLA